jgi:hypothetical protein
MRSSAATELEVEPNVAGRLDELPADQWKNKVAILSLWFHRDEPWLVKIEILERYVTGFKRGTYFPEGDVDYETLVVAPEKAELVKAEDADWEQPGRMLHFAKNYKRQVAAFKRANLDRQHLHLQSVMNNMWGDMMRGAAAEAARQAALQRAVGGR